MSNVAKLAAYILANPTVEKPALIEYAMKEFNTHKQNATVYVYNAQKRIAKDGGEAVVSKRTKKVKDIHAASNKLISEAVKKDPELQAVANIIPKTEEEIARIKAANLKRMKEITARNKVLREKYTQIALDSDKPFDPPDFTPAQAQAELEAMDELDSFQVPKFLNKKGVEALV